MHTVGLIFDRQRFANFGKPLSSSGQLLRYYTVVLQKITRVKLKCSYLAPMLFITACFASIASSQMKEIGIFTMVILYMNTE